jgi:DNA helicase-2/ATP-dependent DNA helicase PcrA
MKISNEELERLNSHYNEEQVKAILSDCPLTIIAGPGSGKTTTIVEKILQTIANEEELKKVLIITFTNEAARNIITRLKHKMGIDINIKNYYIGTFHGVFFKFLYENSHYIYNELGFEKNIHIIEPSEDLKIFTKVCNRYYNPNGKLSKKEVNEVFEANQYMTIKDFFYSVLKETNKPISNLKELHNNIEIKSQAIDKIDKDNYSNIIKDYFNYKREEGMLNFNDILLYVYLLMYNNLDFRSMVSNKFNYIFIDEYQDTNPIQDKLVSLIKFKNDCEVGDGYQSIYKFLNADINNILNLINEPNRNVVQLTKNYRSSSNIVEFTNDITTLFKEKIPNFIECTSENKEVKNLKIQAKDYVFQEYKIIDHIQKSLRNGIPPNEIAIISRANYETMKIEKILLEKGIKYIKLSGKTFYERKEIVTIIDLIKILNKNFNIINFENIAEFMPGLGMKTIEKLSESFMTKKNKKSTLKEIILQEFPKNDKLKKLSELLLTNDNLDYYIFKTIFNSSILNIKEQLMETSSTTSGRKEIERNISIFLEEVETILNSSNRNDLEEFLSIVSLDKKEKNKENREKSIVITTAHSSKGLEWQNCYILNATDGKFPSEKSFYYTEELEEEKRLFYVAISRAKEFLMLTSENDLNQFIVPFLNSKYMEYETGKTSNSSYLF